MKKPILFLGMLLLSMVSQVDLKLSKKQKDQLQRIQQLQRISKTQPPVTSPTKFKLQPQDNNKKSKDHKFNETQKDSKVQKFNQNSLLQDNNNKKSNSKNQSKRKDSKNSDSKTKDKQTKQKDDDSQNKRKEMKKHKKNDQNNSKKDLKKNVKESAYKQIKQHKKKKQKTQISSDTDDSNNKKEAKPKSQNNKVKKQRVEKTPKNQQKQQKKHDKSNIKDNNKEDEKNVSNKKNGKEYNLNDETKVETKKSTTSLKLSKQHENPKKSEKNKTLSKNDADQSDSKPISLKPNDFKMLQQKLTIIDTRPTAQDGLIKGSYWFADKQIIKKWIGAVLKKNTDYLLVTQKGKQKETVSMFRQLGYKNIKGINGFDVKDFSGQKSVPVMKRKSELELDKCFNLKLKQKGECMGAVEKKEKKVPKGLVIPLDELEERVNELKGKENIVINCKDQNEAKVAYSILANKGIYCYVLSEGTQQLNGLGYTVVKY